MGMSEAALGGGKLEAYMEAWLFSLPVTAMG
jgi:hypothetical protein